MIKVESLQYSESQFANKLMVDYYAKKEEIKSFFAFTPDLSGLMQAADERNFSKEKRQILHSVIDSQLSSLDITPTPNQINNLNWVLDENTFTITTGHQLCLLTGPLYTIYKIASTIKLAKQLNNASENKKFIPIYWLASEDHDFEEINHVNIYGKQVKWEQPIGNAVGRMPLNGLTATIAEYLEILGEGNFSEETKEIFSKAYAEGRNLAQATYILINELFKDQGLIILDGDNAELKGQAKDIFSQELQNKSYQEIVNSTSDDLVKLGYKKQVNPREINIFYLNNEKRIRIVREGDVYQLDDSGKKHSMEEVLQLLEDHPERFSPNVIMRPIYQETVLPNIAYIGGAGELTYWFQLKKGFENFNLPFPVLLLRNSALIVDPNNQIKLDKLSLNSTLLFGDFEELLKSLVRDSSEEELSLIKEKGSVMTVFDQIISKGEAIDKSMIQFAQAEKRKTEKAIEVIEKKFLQAEKRKHEVSLNQVKKVRGKLFPEGSLQERSNNFFQYYLAEGNEIIRNLIDSFEPLELDILIYNYTNSKK